MITLIMPFRNAEQWLTRSCESLKNAKGQFEFILVDDHSEDNGRYIAEHYARADKRFKVMKNERTPGVSGARNTGLDHAKGEWITFLDADDELLPDAYEKFFSATLTGCDFNQFNHLRNYRRDSEVILKYPNLPGLFYSENLPKCFCMVWNKLYRKTLVDSVRFKEGLQYGEDELFNLECLAKCNKVHCKDEATMIHHLDNKESLSRSKKAEHLFEQNDALVEFLKRQTDPRIRKAVLFILSEHWNSPTFIRHIGDDYILPS